MMNKTLIIVSAIIIIGLLTSIAILKGIDGAIFMSSLSIIGGLAGYELKRIKDNHIK